MRLLASVVVVCLASFTLGVRTAEAAPRKLGVVSAGGAADGVAASLAGNVSDWKAARLAPAGLATRAAHADQVSATRLLRAAGTNAHVDAVLFVRVVPTAQGRRASLLLVDTSGTDDASQTEVELPKSPRRDDGVKVAAALEAPLLGFSTLAAAADTRPTEPKAPDAKAAETRKAPDAKAAETRKAPRDVREAPKPPRSEADRQRELDEDRAKEREHEMRLLAMPNPAVEGGVDGPVEGGARDAEQAPAFARAPADALVRPTLRVAAAAGIAGRAFRYEEATTESLRAYDLAGAPVASLRAEAFPLARSRHALARALGVEGAFTSSLGLASRDPAADAALSTSWSRWSVAARARVPVTSAIYLGGSFGYVHDAFTAAVPEGTAAIAPNVAYRALRPAAEASFVLAERVALEVSAAWLPVLSIGEVATRIRGAHASGLEASAGARVALGRHLDVGVLGALSRWALAFAPAPGDVNQAGGAVDQTWRAELALGGHL